MSKQSEQQGETLERLLELCTVQPNTTEKSGIEPEMILNFDMPAIIEGFPREDFLGLTEKFPV